MTVESAIKNYVEWLKNELAEVKYGTVGLVFDLADGCVTRTEKISKVSEKPGLIKITWIPAGNGKTVDTFMETGDNITE